VTLLACGHDLLAPRLPSAPQTTSPSTTTFVRALRWSGPHGRFARAHVQNSPLTLRPTAWNLYVLFVNPLEPVTLASNVASSARCSGWP